MATHTLLLLAMASVSLVCARVVDARSLPEGSRRRSLEGRAEWQPMRCNATSSSPSAPPTCTSYLYVTPNGRSPATVASDLSVNAALMQPIRRQSGEVDLLAQVPCVCEGAAGNGAAAAAALFHDTIYTVKTGDTPASVSDKIFGGLAVDFADGGSRLVLGERITVHLPCGCSSSAAAAAEGVLSYEMQEGDDMREIATLFSCKNFGCVHPRSKGGVIRGCDGRVVVAFSERTEHWTVGVVEARAMIHGLRLALSCFVERIVVEGDDLVLVQLLRGEETQTRIPAAMHDEIVGLLSCFAECEVQHIYREGNSVAHVLCRQAYERPGTWMEPTVMPAAVCAKLDDDLRGVLHERRLRKLHA
ncbi:hypothetical protein E2562_037785 [Oryza meyeriana var. granulata]|uniref:RNase H type-1 domain-containing protein n=1 Tax=Oryza meyeriana var. granulata TaxID=110450 RepID=A0A6G1E825_9ORYZ|nr:hypothetical protein E2562_037785 [Oryza meyeriana var. granulata]